MISPVLGNDISVVEVTHISTHGIWLFTRNEEFLMSYENFPWFKDQPVKAMLSVEKLSEEHYYWPMIDVDLTKEIIQNPERFPLKAKTI